MVSRTEKRQSQRKTAAKTGGIVAAAGIMGVLGLIVVVGIMATKKMNQFAEDMANMDTVETPVDPFAGLAPDAPVARKKPTSSGGFSGMDFESKAADWIAAQDIQARAAVLHSKSSDLRLDGDAEWHAVAKEAKGLYEEAMEMARAYRVAYAGEFGETSAETKRLDKKINIWNRALIGLHKTGA